MKKIMLAAVTFVLAPAAFSSWKFQDFSSPSEPNAACMIYVTDKVDKTELRLEISRPKGGAGPAEVFIREMKQSSGAKTWVAVTETTKSFVFAEMLNDGQQRIFWHLPVQTQMIIDHFGADKQLSVATTGLAKNKKLKFSRMGFEKALKTIQNQCLNGQPLVDTAFEKQFVSQVSYGPDMGVKSLDQIIRLRQIYNQAYKNTLDQVALDKKINQIVSQYQPTLSEYELVTQRIKNLVQTVIPQLETQIQKQKNDRALAEKTLKDIKAALPGLQAAVTRDQKVLSQAEAARAPYEAENDRLSDLSDRADSILRSAQARLGQVQRDISTTERQLSEARYELSNLKNQLSDLEWRARQAQDELRIARRDRDSFDPNYEIRRRLQSNPRIGRLEAEIRQLDSEVLHFERQAESARMERDRRKQDLAQCQSQSGADCSAQQAALQSAESQLAQVVGELRDRRARLNNVRSEHQRLVSEIENDVRREQDRLDDRLRNAIERNRLARERVENAQIRIRDLEVTVIPGYERDLRELDRDLRLAQNDVSSAEVLVQNADRDLEAYRKKVGWHQKTEAIRVASENLEASETRLSEAVANQSRQEQIITNSQANQKEFEAQLSVKQSELSQQRLRESQLIAVVNKYKQERAPLDAQAEQLKKAYLELFNEYKVIAG